MKVKKARRDLQRARRRAVENALKNRRIPLWRRVADKIGWHGPLINWLMNWDAKSKKAEKKAMKKASHFLARSN